MLQLQLIFNKTDELQQRARIIKKSIADALANDRSYTKAKDDLKIYKAELKQAEARVKDDFSHELGELDRIKADLASEKQLLADTALSALANGEVIEIKDKGDNVLEPIFSVRFKKN